MTYDEMLAKQEILEANSSIVSDLDHQWMIDRH